MGDMESVTDDIRKNIKSGKDISFDFLEDADNYLLVAKLISSFSNTQGGRIVFGVRENGKINGVLPNEIIDNVNELILVHQLMDIVLTYKQLKIERHLLVLCDVEIGNDKRAIELDGKPNYFIRIGGRSLLANKIILRMWAMKMNSHVKINALDSSIVDVMAKKRIDSLSKLYKEFPLRNSDVDLSLSKLIFLKQIELYEKENTIKYRLCSTKSLN